MKPFILDYTIERKGEIKTLYKYDFNESLNVITVGNKKIPFIDSTTDDIALLTKTKVIQESDDSNDLLELMTKTEVYREKDDDCGLFLELKTKTFTNQERDDEGINYN